MRQDGVGGGKSERETPPVCIIDLDLSATTCSPPPASKQSRLAATPPPTQPGITSPCPLYTQPSPLGDRWPPLPRPLPSPNSSTPGGQTWAQIIGDATIACLRQSAPRRPARLLAGRFWWVQTSPSPCLRFSPLRQMMNANGINKCS